MLSEVEGYDTSTRHADFPPGTRVLVTLTIWTPHPDDPKKKRASWVEKAGVVHAVRVMGSASRRYWIKFDDGTEANEILSRAVDVEPVALPRLFNG